ncbi:MAG: hypothetical protein IIA14_11265 [SAR324 cluster bacterium]|nr:hypothetical protein [SAR324 cluster bacterium]
MQCQPRFSALLLISGPVEAKPLFFSNIHIIEGTGRPLIRDASILIRDGKIAEVSQPLSRGGNDSIAGKAAAGVDGHCPPIGHWPM